MSDNHGILLTERCAASEKVVVFPYSTFSMFAMAIYYILLMDLGVFINKFSAYMLVCEKVSVEVCLFILMTMGVLVAFSTSFSCLNQPLKEFAGFQHGSLALWEMVLGLFDVRTYQTFHDVPVILLGVFIFWVVILVVLANLLVAQLCCAYDEVFNDMVGFARLKRISVTVESMNHVSPARWIKFVQSLRFQDKIEFEQGDNGLGNGIQSVEAAQAHPTLVDTIKRFGGSTSPSMPWPEEASNLSSDADRWERLEMTVKKVMERLNNKTKEIGMGHVSSTMMSGAREENSSMETKSSGQSVEIPK